MSIILYLLVGVVVLAYYLVKKRYRYWDNHGFASPPSTFPLGSLKGVGTKITECEGIDVIYKMYKGKHQVVGTYFLLQPHILPIDPELYKNILVRDFATFHDRGFYYNKENDPLSAK